MYLCGNDDGSTFSGQSLRVAASFFSILYSKTEVQIMKNRLKKALLSILACSLTLSSTLIPSTPTSTLLTAEMTADATDGQIRYAGNVFSYEILPGSNAVKLNDLVSISTSSCSLPSSVTALGKTYAVTEIGNEFAAKANLNSITIPDSVRIIGHSFAEESTIRSITIGKNVRSIELDFCSDCKSLKTVTYTGTDLTKLGNRAFANTLFIQSANAKGAVTMNDWLIKYIGSASSIRILDLSNNSPDIRKIAGSAFEKNLKLQSVNLNGISVVGDRAFYSCKNLKTVTDGYALTSVGSNAFSETAWFSTQKNNNGGTVILGRTLLNYTKISNNTVDLTNLNVQIIAYYALSAVDEAKAIKLPNSILTVDSNAFGASNSMASFSDLYLYNQKITYSNYNSSQYKDFMRSNMAAFTHSKWGADMALQKGKAILNSLGLTYVGNGSKGSYSVRQQYDIINKLYHYVGGKHEYRYQVDGGSHDYIEEMFYKKGIVCGGYAELNMYLLELAGINAECIYGPGHAYNVVSISGDWFNVDACWYRTEDLFLVSDIIAARETKYHADPNLSKPTLIPSEMFTLNGTPWCKYTLGDVNRDGQLDLRDAAMFREYLLNARTLDQKQLVLSDVNKDGKFNILDLETMYAKADIGTRKLGDVTGDGKINRDDLTKLQNYLLGAVQLDEKSRCAADVLMDGVIDSYDLVQARRLVSYPMGDVNMDGTVNEADAAKLESFIIRTVTLSNESKIRADVNYDGLINTKDSALIRQMR